MEKISINDIKIVKNINYGSFSKIYEIVFNNKKYAFKQFKDGRIYAKGLIPKYEQLNEFSLKKSVVPNVFVEDGKMNGFLMPLHSHKCFSFLYSCPLEYQIQTLKNAKNALLELHTNNIIHGDIHVGNFLLRECLLTDFDNSQFKRFLLNPELCSAEAMNFLTTYKLSKDLDIYLFNFMTFSILNECYYYNLESRISDKKYGVFTSKDSIKICKSLLLEDKVFNNDFLIDTINLEDIKRKSKKNGRG